MFDEEYINDYEMQLSSVNGEQDKSRLRAYSLIDGENKTILNNLDIVRSKRNKSVI